MSLTLQKDEIGRNWFKDLSSIVNTLRVAEHPYSINDHSVRK